MLLLLCIDGRNSISLIRSNVNDLVKRYTRSSGGGTFLFTATAWSWPCMKQEHFVIPSFIISMLMRRSPLADGRPADRLAVG